MICTLAVSDNNCPFLAEDKKHCNSINSNCSFRKEVIETSVSSKGYVRKERWYEKYYK